MYIPDVHMLFGFVHVNIAGVQVNTLHAHMFFYFYPFIQFPILKEKCS